ncbi:ATP-binding cassette domain-containing protein [Thiospirochaeta perfilievii]|uniref:ATP-binding cassette domain-containing protein n=1 Tax=Thiospirochaeta perfilievii TaxID=252967 RepID=A0A5C1Q862_9SPIO|nr:ATP-binding cassette domain-containing protein [Thiospirochaeta perfilievii]QEN03230.1 ATP-binding cassette domain-containing protein [Thiospirochaeta perfilievii]
MVKLTDLNKVFFKDTVNENHVLKGINLEIKKGDFITIIGSNGAGKSTLFNLISGNLECSSGTVHLKNKDITKIKEHKRAKYIGRIFQNPLLGTAGNMSLEDNMIITGSKGFKGLKISLNNKKREQFKTVLRELDMGLEYRLKDNVGLLSGGQRQALTLLMMVLSRPELVLLDEHTAALDPRNAEKVLNLTDNLFKKYDLTGMMITHNMEHAIKYGNRLLMMDKGEIILDVSGKEKDELTVNSLVQKFHDIRSENYINDETLLS